MTTFRMKRNEYFVSGPEVEFETATVRCCRDWEVVRKTSTWNEGIDGWNRESWWWRKCGICHEIPQLIEDV